MERDEHVYRRKKDAYYIILLAYVVFAVGYILITGTVTDEEVAFGFKDPVVYIIGAFILITSAALVAIIVRNPKLAVTSDSLILRDRFRERVIPFSRITGIVVKRARARVHDGTFALVLLRVSNSRRRIKLRRANYERENELYGEFKRLKHELRK